MKKVLLIIAGIVFLFLAFNQWIVNHYNGDSFSNSEEESKKEGFFLSDYFPDKDSIIVNGRKVATVMAWSEVGWKSNHVLVFFPTKRILKDEVNFVISDESSYCSNREYIYASANSYSKSLNCIKGLGFSIRYFEPIGDSVVFYVKHRSKIEDWKKEIISDTIIYKRR